MKFNVPMLKLFLFFALLTAWGCDDDPESAADPATPDLSVRLIANGPLDDFGFNQSHRDAIEYVDSIFGDRVDARALGSVPETSDSERVMRRLVNEGASLVIAASFGYQDFTTQLAAEQPDVDFMQAWGTEPRTNLQTYSSEMYQAWYAMGVLAGLSTEDAVLGVVAAFPIPPMFWQINAFTLGARSVRDDIEVRVTFINDWFDPGLASDAANALVDQGADVLTGILDNSVAVAQVAEERNVRLIGHNADLSRFAPTAQLGGTRWIWGRLYEDAIREALDSSFDGTDGDLHGGIDDGYVGFSPYGPTVPEDVRSRVDAVIDSIRAGNLAVYSGPIIDQDGSIAVPAGETLSHAEIMGMGFLVQGVR